MARLDASFTIFLLLVFIQTHLEDWQGQRALISLPLENWALDGHNDCDHFLRVNVTFVVLFGINACKELFWIAMVSIAYMECNPSRNYCPLTLQMQYNNWFYQQVEISLCTTNSVLLHICATIYLSMYWTKWNMNQLY